MEQPETARRRWLRVLLGLAISSAAVWLALQEVDLNQVVQIIGKAQPTYLTLALLGVLLSHLMKALRWQILLGESGKPLGFLRLIEALTIAQFFNLVLPLRVGEVSRVVLLSRRSLSGAFVLGTIVLEKFLDVLVFALMFILLVLLLPLPGWVEQPGVILLVGVLSVSLFLLAIIRRRGALFAGLEQISGGIRWRWWDKLQGWLRSGLASLDILHSPAAALKLALVSTAVWSAAALTNQMVLLALGLDLPVSAALLVLIATQAVFSLPSAPGKLGVFEYTCVLALAVFTLDKPTALSYGILLHGVGYLPVIFLGLFFLLLTGFSGNPAKLSTKE